MSDMTEYRNCVLCGTDVPPWTDAGIDGDWAVAPGVCDECKEARQAQIPPFGEIPEGTTCRNCKEHPGTVRWAGNASALDVNHGAPVYAWCRCCTIKQAISYAEEQAALLPELRAQLERPCEDDDGQPEAADLDGLIKETTSGGAR